MSLTAASTESNRPPKRQWLAMGLLAAVTLTAYLPVTRNGEVWDDDQYITTRVAGHQRSLTDLWHIWASPTATPQYYPLVHTCFWVEYHLWGTHMLGYHLVNLALHALSACLLFLVFRRLKIPGGDMGAWAAAALWAVHPLTVESVAWATERKNVLAMTLAAGAFLALLRFYRIGPPEAPETPERNPGEDDPGAFDGRWLAPALALFLAALLSKTVISTLPAVMVLVLWWKKPRVTWRMLVPLTPFLLLGMGLGSVTAYLEVHHVGASGPDWMFSPAAHVLIAGRVVWFYVGKFFWPHPLMFIYPRWAVDPTAGWQYFFPLAVVAVLGVLLALSRRIGRGPLVGALIFVGMLTPALGFFPVYPMRFSFVADHFAYPALAALAALLVGAAAWMLRRVGRAPAGVAVAVILAALATVTWNRCRDYRDARTLWYDTYRQNPRSIIANGNLAKIAMESGHPEEAVRFALEAERLDPGRTYAQDEAGSFLYQAHRLDEALPHFEKAVELFGDVHCPERGADEAKIGLVYQDRKDWKNAAIHYQLALADNPADARAGLGLGQCLMQFHRYDEAVAVLRDFVRVNNGLAAGFYTLGAALAHLGRLDEAEEAYQRTTLLAPGDVGAHLRYGDVLAELGRFKEAGPQFEEAVRLMPDNGEAHRKLGQMQANVGRFEQAVASLRKAVELSKGQDLDGLITLARVLGVLGRYDQAMAASRQALRVAEAQSQPAAAAQVQAMMAAYQAGQPWTPAPPSTPPPPGG